MASKFFLVSIWLWYMATVAMAQTNDLVGTWRLDVYRSIEIMDSQCKAKYDTLPAETRQRAASRMHEREFVLLDDGVIIVNWNSHKGKQVSRGRWIKDDTAKTLSITIDTNTTEYNYDIVSKNTLIMRSKVKGGFFDNFYLVKAN